jgi:polyketide cyclase/dehydrase/lipid transport protein
MALIPPMTASVTVPMKATPSAVWALITDVTRIGEFSPETRQGRWIDPATGAALGARFQGQVKRNGRGPMYWTTCRVVACEPLGEFAFVVEVPGMRGVNTWRYRIAPRQDGCEVTESFELSPLLPLKLYWALFGRLRTATNRDGMRATLQRMRAVVEQN